MERLPLHVGFLGGHIYKEWVFWSRGIIDSSYNTDPKQQLPSDTCHITITKTYETPPASATPESVEITVIIGENENKEIQKQEVIQT